MKIEMLILLLLCLALQCAAPAQTDACTSFCMDGEEGPVFGANLDLRWGEGLLFVNRRGLAKSSYMLNPEGERLEWTALYGSVTFNLVGIEMPWGGMNEAGLTGSTMQLSVTTCPGDDERYPVSGPQWLQYMLDTCATVDEVIARADSVRMKLDEVHFLLADANGDCVVVEWLEGRMYLYAGDDLPVKALANAMYHETVAYIEREAKPAFNPGRSVQRAAAAAYWGSQWDPAGDIEAADWALGVLTEACVDPKSWWKNLVGEPYTRWSVSYDIARREIRFLTVDHTETRRLAFANLDFDCGAPALMLDVNAELEGPIEGDLQRYDAQRNYEFSRVFLNRWGVDLGDEEVRELTAFLEGFACAP